MVSRNAVIRSGLTQLLDDDLRGGWAVRGVLPARDGYFHLVSGEPPAEPLPDRHDIEVYVDGAWAPGELRRVKVVDGVEVHTVRYVDPDGQSHVGNFPAGLVRPDETDPDSAR